MITSKRRFIRLNEVTEKTNLTQGDILDAIENEKLNFSALIESNYSGALIKQDEQFHVAAVFDYHGMVKLTPKVSKQFAITLEAQSTDSLLILQPDRVTNWRAVPDAFTNLENTGLPYLAKADNQPTQIFLAYAMVHGQPTLNHITSNFASTVSAFFSDKEKVEAFKAKYPESDAVMLKAKPIKIEPQRLRLDLHEIVNVFGNDSVTDLVQQMQSPVTSTTKTNISTESYSANQPVLTHPIEQIVHRVLQIDPTARADKIWNLIRADVRQEDKRQYDTDEIIESMTADDIRWFGKGVNTENEMGYDAFRKNTVYKVRKLVKTD